VNRTYVCLLARLRDDCSIYSFRNWVLYSAMPSTLLASFSKYRPGYAVSKVCVGFMVDQVALRKVSINVFQSSVNYHVIKSSYTVCTIWWIDSECNGGWRSWRRQSPPIMKKYIHSYNNLGLRESFPGLHGYRVLSSSLRGTSWGWRNSWVSAVFCVKNELRQNKQLSVECFLRGVRAEAEETVEYLLFSAWRTNWGW
jgi:hypothetical protein